MHEDVRENQHPMMGIQIHTLLPQDQLPRFRLGRWHISNSQILIAIHFKQCDASKSKLRILGTLAVTYYIHICAVYNTLYDTVSLYLYTSVKSGAHVCCADASLLVHLRSTYEQFSDTASQT